MSAVRWFLVVMLIGLLGACSSVPTTQRLQQRQAAYVAAAGTPVSSFRYFMLYSWEPLSDSELVVYTRPDQAWLLDVWPTCPNLTFTQAIGLTSSIREVTVGFDRVLTGGGYIPCTIKQIRPVNLAQLKIEREAQRAVQTQPRTDNAPVSSGH